MANVNLRLKRPSSSTRLLSRVAVFDVVWAGTSPFVAFLLRNADLSDILDRAGTIAAYCAIALLCSIIVFQWFQTSAPIARYFSVSDAFELLKACLIIATLSAVLVFLFTRLDAAPRSVPILNFIVLTSGLFAARLLWRLRAMRRESRSQKVTATTQHALIIGASRLAWFFSKMLEELAPGECQIVAILDEQPKMQHRSLNGYPIIGSPLHLGKIIDEYAMHGVSVDKVIVAVPPEVLSRPAWNHMSETCSAHGVGLEILSEQLIPGLSTSARRNFIGGPAPVQDSSVLEPDGSNAFIDRPFWKLKRVIDFTIALSMGVVLSPVILAAVVLALLDVGMPVVFWQQRAGLGGAPLYLYKFRTLQTLFDRRTQQRRDAQHPSSLGRFLRATRLDELPQIWNILAGDMSLIGPRPLLPVDQPANTTVRLSVRPGVSGWAQVCGGKLISPVEKNALDEWYIRHASLALDMMIGARTVWMVLRGDRRDEQAIATALAESAQSEHERFAGRAATDDGSELGGDAQPTRVLSS